MEYKVFDNKIYDDQGLLILKLTIGGSWKTDYPELAAKVPAQIKYLAASNMYQDLRN